MVVVVVDDGSGVATAKAAVAAGAADTQSSLVNQIWSPP
jgi:hypothetical protein